MVITASGIGNVGTLICPRCLVSTPGVPNPWQARGVVEICDDGLYHTVRALLHAVRAWKGERQGCPLCESDQPKLPHRKGRGRLLPALVVTQAEHAGHGTPGVSLRLDHLRKMGPGLLVQRGDCEYD